MRVGDVIKKEDSLHVITKMVNGIVAETEKLNIFVARNAVIKENGEMKTIEEVLQERCNLYLTSGVKIIES